MSLIPSDAANVLEQLLSGLSATDNQVRASAEKLLDSEWMNPDKVGMLLLFLAEHATLSPEDHTRAFSAVLLRRLSLKCPKNATSVTDRNIAHIEEPIREHIRNILLQGFVSQQSNTTRHKLCDVISEVAKEDSSPQGSWPQLIPALFEATLNPDASFRESAFRVFSAAPELIDKSHLNQVSSIFVTAFEDDNDDVRIAACLAFVAYFQGLPKSSWQSLAPLLPGLLNSLPRFLQNDQGDALGTVLEHLIELVELAPKMFKDMFPTIIEFCAAVSKNKDMEGAARMSALELLTTFSEVSPAMCKRVPAFTDNIVLITLSMLTEVSIDDDEAAEWNNLDDTEADGEDEAEYESARLALDRVALRLNGQSLAGPLFQYLPAMLQSQEWRERHAALMALSSVAEGCVDSLMGEIPRLLDMVLPTLNDPHSRVQYAGCNAVGQMSTDFANVIQKIAGDRILPALISKLTTLSTFRVQAHAAAALVNFCEAATKETLEPYLDSLLTNLLGLLQSPKRYVQEQILITIATIADAAQTKFIKYYDSLMPLLLGVLKSDLGDESNEIKGKCIECSTLIALAVGKEKFAPDFTDIVQVFGALQESLLEADNPILSYLGHGWSRICKVMGKDFLPLMPIVLPPLLEAAKAAQDISLVDEDEAEHFHNSDEFDVIQLSGKLIAVHTAVLDEKVTAIDLLRSYASQLGGEFLPWVPEVVQEICVPALEFYLHDGVRGLAALTLASMLRCSVQATGRTSTNTLEIWSQISNKLVDALTSEPIPELLVAYYTALVDSIQVLGEDCLLELQLTKLARSINANLMEIYERVKSRENDDDEYAEDIEEGDDEYTDEELLDEISKTASAIFKSSKAAFLGPFQVLAPTVGKLANDDNTSMKVCGLSIVCEAVEYCGPAFAPYRDIFTPAITESLLSPLAELRQAAAYFVGVAALHGGDEYQNFCVSSLQPMFKMIAVPDARADENVYATENCVTAVAKVCHRHGSCLPNLGEILQQWIAFLPIAQDEEAAPFAYRFLGELMNSQHPAVMTQIPKVVDSVIQALAHGVLSGESAQSVVTSTRQILGTMPQGEAVALLSKNASDVDVVQKYFS